MNENIPLGQSGLAGTPAPLQPHKSRLSAVAWSAVLGGALVAVAVTVMLLALGSGIGLASVSPWLGSNPSPTTFTVMTAIWLIIVQWLSSGVGGYLTGRMRTKWVEAHSHEVFFRDTANGLLTWAVASVVVVGVAASVGTSALSGATRTAATVASGAAAGAGQMAQGAVQSGQTDYLVDTLFRPAQPNANAPAPQTSGEAARILATGLNGGTVAPADRTYLAQLVAARAGVPQADAEKRVDDVIAKAKAAEDRARAAADAARKAVSSFSFFTFFSMLIGAFIACAAAAFGGLERDEI